MKPQMNTDKHRWVILGLIIVLFAAGSVEAPYSQDNILVIDLSKRLPDNPYQEEYEKMLYPTVRIMAGNSTGSGVIFETTDEHGLTQYILTAAHVVGDQSEVTVELFYPKNIEIEATVIITDTIKDLALLHTPCPLFLEGNKKSPLERGGAAGVCYSASLAPSDYQPYIFTPVYSVGCSLGYPPRPSNGIISVITDSYWEITSPILPGNSGGPVFDGRTYEVIGIAVWVHTYQGQLVTTMAGVVPINEIYEFLESVPTE